MGKDGGRKCPKQAVQHRESGGGCEGVRWADHFHKNRESRAAVMDLRVCAHHAFTMDGNLAMISDFLQPRRLLSKPSWARQWKPHIAGWRGAQLRRWTCTGHGAILYSSVEPPRRLMAR